MAKAEQSRALRVYHVTVAILTLLAGGGLLGLGLWLRQTSHRGLFGLDADGVASNYLEYALRRAFIVVIASGAFLMATALVSLAALARQCLGLTFRVLYVLMAAVVLAALLIVSALSGIVLRNARTNVWQEDVRTAWTSAVLVGPEVTCQLEQSFQCRGFEAGDCANCPAGREQACTEADRLVCADCGTERPERSEGCYDAFVDRLWRALLPAAIVSALLAALILVDMMLMCCM